MIFGKHRKQPSHITPDWTAALSYALRGLPRTGNAGCYLGAHCIALMTKCSERQKEHGSRVAHQHGNFCVASYPVESRPGQKDIGSAVFDGPHATIVDGVG